jgi:hypothetical protein
LSPGTRSNKRWFKFQLIWEIQRGGTSVLVRLEFQAIFVTRKIHRIVVVTAVVVVVEAILLIGIKVIEVRVSVLGVVESRIIVEISTVVGCCVVHRCVVTHCCVVHCCIVTCIRNVLGYETF